MGLPISRGRASLKWSHVHVHTEECRGINTSGFGLFFSICLKKKKQLISLLFFQRVKYQPALVVQPCGSHRKSREFHVLRLAGCTAHNPSPRHTHTAVCWVKLQQQKPRCDLKYCHLPQEVWSHLFGSIELATAEFLWGFLSQYETFFYFRKESLADSI